MRSVYQAESLIDAQLVKDALEAEGIPAFVIGAGLTGAMGELPVSGLVDVRVPDSAWPAARSIAARVDAWLRESPADDAQWDGQPQPV